MNIQRNKPWKTRINLAFRVRLVQALGPMCGIAGIVHFDRDRFIDPSTLDAMAHSLRHRGPDGKGTVQAEGVGLVHTRLSIIDLSENASQPMSNAKGDLTITYNGEIYNFQELRSSLEAKCHVFRSRSDTEVILSLYEEYGERCVEYLDGMFAFALYDRKNHKVFLARDRVGIKPLYYYRDGTKLVFGSEIKAIFQERSVPLAINHKAFSQYLKFMTVTTPDTIYEGIRRLRPGHTLTVQNGKVTESCFWDVEKLVADPVDPNEAVALLAKTLESGVRSHLIADVPVGAFLSGGLDSSGIVAMASRIQPTPIKTFSVVFPDWNDYDESPFSKRVADHCHTEHLEFRMKPDFVDVLPRIIAQCDEPFAISSSIALYLMAQKTAEKVKVVLTGDGSDELFAGYPRHFTPRRGERFSRLVPAPVRGLAYHGLQALAGSLAVNTNNPPFARLQNIARHLLSPEDEFYAEQVSSYCTSLDVKGILVPEYYRREIKPHVDELDESVREAFATGEVFDGLNRRLYTDLKTSLVDEMLTKVDRMTMAFGLEARVPYLDNHVVDLAFRIQGAQKAQGLSGKAVLKKVFEPLLPQEIVHRPKWGFNVPLNPWFKEGLRQFLDEHLSERELARTGIFSPRAVSELAKNHRRGKVDNSNKLFQILVWNLWYDQFAKARN